MNTQLEAWKGEFGDAYTDRNIVDWRERVPGFRKMLNGCVIGNVCEVGCNRGHNLRALFALGYDVHGVEPNAIARQIARDQHLNVDDGDIYNFARLGGLVLCCGVLIHIPPARIAEAMDNLVDASLAYVLSIEYAAESETEVMYHGLPAMLWKRDYGALWSNRADVTLAATGELGPTWDDATYWLLEKR